MNRSEKPDRNQPTAEFDPESLETELRHLPKPTVPPELESRLLAAVPERSRPEVRAVGADTSADGSVSVTTESKRERGKWKSLIAAVGLSAAVIGTISAMLLPTINRARERARIVPASAAPQQYVSRQMFSNDRGSVTGIDERIWRAGASRAGKTDVFLCPTDAAVDGLSILGEGAVYNAINWGFSSNFNTEAYDHVVDNPFLTVAQNPLSTFSIDVDTASYANVRRFLKQNMLPPAGAVRIEELVNYFSYDYPPPDGDVPFSADVEIAGCPWEPKHRLVRIGLKGREVEENNRPASNLVFLVDVSGSMQPENKLPLLKRAMQMLVRQLTENDRVAVAVYAGASGLVLPSTSCDNQETILAALDDLEAGGSTNGGEGIQLAYDLALANFIKGGVNRVVLCTDGDFNVGVTNQDALVRLIEEKARSGVFLSVLGFGMGNYKDSTLEKLADKGNGNYAYVDTLNEARKVLVEQRDGTLVTIAKDVKIQIEFNPARVAAHRLIGYENRLLFAEDFDDDTKDAGEIGAGHTVTALYEIVPAGEEIETPAVKGLKYQKAGSLSEAAGSGELLTLSLRYKAPDGDRSSRLDFPIRDRGQPFARAGGDFKFASAVAAFGMLLRGSPYKGNATLDAVLEIAEEGKGTDPHGYRAELIELVKQARAIRRD